MYSVVVCVRLWEYRWEYRWTFPKSTVPSSDGVPFFVADLLGKNATQ